MNEAKRLMKKRYRSVLKAARHVVKSATHHTSDAGLTGGVAVDAGLLDKLRIRINQLDRDAPQWQFPPGRDEK